MDPIFTGLISGVVLLPLLVSLNYFIKAVTNIPSIFMIQLLLANILVILWVLAGIPVLVSPELFLLNDIILIEHLGVIAGSLTVNFIFLTFSTSYFGNKMVILPRLGVGIFSIIIGLKLSLILINNPFETIYGLRISENTLQRHTHPLISLLALTGFLLLIIVLLVYSIWQSKFPNYFITQETKNNSFLSALLIGLGIIINFVGIILPSSYLTISNFALLISRFIVAMGFIFMSLQFYKNPIITLTEKNNPKTLLNNGIIGWILITTTDRGPYVQFVSEQTKSLYKFSEKDLTLFSVSSISIVGIGGTFIENRFIIPFKTQKHDLSAICYSFTLEDPTLKDQRKKGVGENVFAIIVPNIVINYLGNVSVNSFSITKKIEEAGNLQEFIKNTNFYDETLFTLRNLLLEKIS